LEPVVLSESVAEACAEASAGSVAGIKQKERLAVAVQLGGARKTSQTGANNNNHARNLLFRPKKRKRDFISLRRDRAKPDFP
jgi:hypothetical protein